MIGIVIFQRYISIEEKYCADKSKQKETGVNLGKRKMHDSFCNDQIMKQKVHKTQ